MGVCDSKENKTRFNETEKFNSMNIESNSSEIEKEEHIKGHFEALSKNQAKIIFEQMDKSICKINNEKAIGTGFLCLIPFPDSLSLLRVLITCNHVLNDLTIGNKIKLIFDGK